MDREHLRVAETPKRTTPLEIYADSGQLCRWGRIPGRGRTLKIIGQPQWDYSFLAYQIKIISEPQVLSRQEEL